MSSIDIYGSRIQSEIEVKNMRIWQANVLAHKSLRNLLIRKPPYETIFYFVF